MPDTLILYRDDTDNSGLNLSSYVDLDSGGIDPGDEEVREPVMSAGGLGYGEQLVYERVHSRPFTVALLLNAASPDALGALQQTIERTLRGAAPVVSWKRQGATATTFWRIRHGRVLGSARYDQKMEAQTFNGRRTLALICEPFGTGSRHLASAVPVTVGPTGPGWASIAPFSSPFSVAPSNPAVGLLPSIGGDAPVLWRIAIGATAASPMGDAFVSTGMFPQKVVAGLTATPFTPFGYNAAASLTHVAGTQTGPTAYITDPWSPAVNALGTGLALGFNGSHLASGQSISLGGNVGLLNPAGGGGPTAYPPGLYRAFACVRAQQHTSGGSSVPARLQAMSAGIRGPVATLLLRSPSQWAWYDIGDINDTTDITLGFGMPSGWTSAGTPRFLLAGVALIPKMIRYWELDALEGADYYQQLAIGSDPDDGITPAGLMFQAGLPSLMNTRALTRRGISRGDIPVTPPVASGATRGYWLVALAFRGARLGINAPTVTAHSREQITVACSAWDRYTFAK